jgi:transposase
VVVSRRAYFEAQFLPLKARRGPKKAAVAVAASSLTTSYHMLAEDTCYQDLAPIISPAVIRSAP